MKIESVLEALDSECRTAESPEQAIEAIEVAGSMDAWERSSFRRRAYDNVGLLLAQKLLDRFIKGHRAPDSVPLADVATLTQASMDSAFAIGFAAGQRWAEAKQLESQLSDD